jgi:cytochrome c556
VAVLPAMNNAVEGAALRLAEAAVRLGEVASGCVACHQMFRGQPGISPLLLPGTRK